jgi:hypothetical protein
MGKAKLLPEWLNFDLRGRQDSLRLRRHPGGETYLRASSQDMKGWKQRLGSAGGRQSDRPGPADRSFAIDR